MYIDDFHLKTWRKIFESFYRVSLRFPFYNKIYCEIFNRGSKAFRCKYKINMLGT